MHTCYNGENNDLRIELKIGIIYRQTAPRRLFDSIILDLLE